MFVIKNKKLNNYYKGTVGSQFHFVFSEDEAHRFRNFHCAEVRMEGMKNLREFPNLQIVKVKK